MSTDTKAKTKETKTDLFDESNSLRFDYFKFDNVGDSVQGVYVGKYQSESKYGYMQENYVLMQDDGTKLVVSGRGPRKSDGVKIIYGMEKVPLGAVMGFIFAGEKPTTMGNPAKLIEPRYAGEKKLDVLEAFQEKYSMDSFAEESTGEVAEATAVEETADDVAF